MSSRRAKRIPVQNKNCSASDNVILSSNGVKRTANEAELSSLSTDTPTMTDYIFSNPNDSCTRSRLWNWLDAKFVKQDEYIKEQSELIKDMIADIKRSLLLEIEQKFNDLKNEIINDVKREVKELNDRVTLLESSSVEMDKVKAEIHSLKLKHLKQENLVVASDIRITGLPMYKDENLKQIFENICKSLDTTTPSFNAAFRVKHFKNYKDVDVPPIIIRMNSPYDKNYFLKTVAAYRRKYKSPLRLHNAGFQSDTIFYINENLTPHNHGIFKTALGLKKDNLLKSVYTQRGTVYVKQTENSDPIGIYFSDQLNEFFRST